MVVRYLGEEVANLISSIAPTSIQKVTFVHESRGLESHDIDWEILDDPLCRLVDRLRCERELEAVFRLVDADEPTGELEIVNSLARLTEKCRMRVIWVGRDGGESVVYCSDGVA